MTPQDLIAAFEQVAEAPDGVTRLRELVLQLAVRGKLVPQDPEDEPARVLLERIAVEKAQLVRAKAIKRPKKLPPIAEDDFPSELPESWAWARLQDIAVYNGRDKVDPRGEPGDMWLLDLADIEKVSSRLLQRATVQQRPSTSTKSRFEPDDVLYGKLRPYLDKVIVADSRGLCTTEIVPIIPHEGVASAWLRLCLKSPDFIRHVNQLTYGVKMPRLGTQDAIASLQPIPPLPEQHRIVARVDELFSLLDRLEAARNARDTTRAALRDAALAALADADTPEEVESAWDRIAERMDDLFTGPEDIEPLRQTVLQLAVRGRLVPQEPGDEPAERLLERAVAEMDRLRRAKATRIGTDPGGYDRTDPLPGGWVWAQLQHLVQFIDYRGKTPKKVSEGVRLITAKNIKRGFIRRQPEEFVTEATYAEWMTRGFPEHGDVLFTTEAPMGHAALVDLTERFALAQRTINLHPYAGCSGRYLVTLLLSPWFADELGQRATGMTATGIKAAKLRLIRVPVPPLPEQHRIVAKVDALMALLDGFQERLRAAHDTQAAFAAAAVHHMDA